MAVLVLEDALSVRTNLGKHSLFVGLYVSSIKTGARRIICVDELPSFVPGSSLTTEDSSSRWIMRLVPVFILEKYNPTNKECLPRFVQTDNASSSRKTANVKVTNKATPRPVTGKTVQGQHQIDLMNLKQRGRQPQQTTVQVCFELNGYFQKVYVVATAWKKSQANMLVGYFRGFIRRKC